jgi:periplasmic protein TonB
MTNVVGGAKHLERELTPEPIAGPAIGSLALHGGLVVALVAYTAVTGLFHHNLWGSQGSGAAIQVSLVSNALPLPNNQPVNNNVLTTEKPSEAPAAPSPKEEHHVDETAIPISGKQAKQQQKNTPKTQQHQQQQQQDNRARYGEQSGTSIPRGLQSGYGANGPVTVGDSNFASMFGWYVNQINIKMSNNWYRQEVDPRTPRGSRVYLVFTIRRDGSPATVKLDRSSGSYTLDQSCQRAVQRVDTFGALPSAYRQNTLMVSYYCEY